MPGTMTLLVALALALAGCAGTEAEPGPEARGTNTPTTEAAEGPDEAACEAAMRELHETDSLRNSEWPPECEDLTQAQREALWLEVIGEDFNPTTEPAAPDFLPFGDTWSYEDGLSVTVSKPEPFEPTEFALVEGAEAYVVFTIRVVNDTGAPFDPSGTYATVQSANTEAPEVFDSGPPNNLDGPPMTTLLPGREAEWRAGFGVVDPNDLVLELTPSFEHESAIFTTSQP
jgi:hypothetical protein